MEYVSQAVFLVGGKGTRLGHLTQSTPKPLLPLWDDFCFLDLLIEEAARHGFNKILLLAGYYGDTVKQRYDGKRIFGAEIQVLIESEPQGTAGCLKLAEQYLDPWFLLANGDSFFDINLRSLVLSCDDSFDARIALRGVEDASRFGAVEHHDGLVTAFKEKEESEASSADINAGLYLISKRIVERIDGPTSMEHEVFPALVKEQRLRCEAFDGYFIDMGLPDTYELACREIPKKRQRPCAFLDRDGVLNVDHGYTHRIEDLAWIDGAREAILDLNNAGYLVLVVSNQAGVARGFYTVDDVDRFHLEMNAQLDEIGAHIDAFYFCPFHSDGIVEEFTHPDHPNRKPNPGMLLEALTDWPIVVNESFLVGDKESDLAAATAAGVRSFHFQDGNLATFLQSAIKDI